MQPMRDKRWWMRTIGVTLLLLALLLLARRVFAAPLMLPEPLGRGWFVSTNPNISYFNHDGIPTGYHDSGLPYVAFGNGFAFFRVLGVDTVRVRPDRWSASGGWTVCIDGNINCTWIPKRQADTWVYFNDDYLHTIRVCCPPYPGPTCRNFFPIRPSSYHWVPLSPSS